MAKTNWTDPVNWNYSLNKNLVSRWLVTPYGRGGATFRDLADHNHGTRGGNPTWEGTSDRPGGFGALSFDGTLDHFDCGDRTNLDITVAITLSCWVKFNTDGVIADFVSRDDGSNRNFSLQRWSDNLIYWNIYISNSGKFLASSSTVTSGQWYFFAATYDGANMKLYVDGLEAATPKAQTGLIDNDDVSFTIGAREDGMDRVLNGQIDDVSIYDRALSAAEIQANYLNDKAGSYPELNRVGRRISVAADGITMAADAGSFAVTGLAASLEYGRVIATSSGIFTVSAPAASLEHGRVLSAGVGSFSLTGNASNLLHGFVIPADAGLFSLTGSTAALFYNRVVVVDAGLFSLSGPAVNLNKGFTITTDTGSFSLVGSAATLLNDRIIAADVGSFSLAGPAVNLNKGFTITTDTGSFSLVGSTADFLRGYNIEANAGSFSLTGADAGLLLGHSLVASAGSFSLVGPAVGFLFGRSLIAAAGAFDLSGSAVTLVRGRVLIAAAGSFTLTGSAATLSTTSEVLVEPYEIQQTRNIVQRHYVAREY